MKKPAVVVFGATPQLFTTKSMVIMKSNALATTNIHVRYFTSNGKTLNMPVTQPALLCTQMGHCPMSIVIESLESVEGSNILIRPLPFLLCSYLD